MLAEEGFLEEAFLGDVTMNQAWKGRGVEMEQMQLRSILPAVTFHFLGQSGWARECPEGWYNIISGCAREGVPRRG